MSPPTVWISRKTLAWVLLRKRMDSREPKHACRAEARGSMVEARKSTAAELGEAEHKIKFAAQAIADQVARDPRRGLCVVASGALSRVLGELGVWNYNAKSNLVIHFPQKVSPEPRYFYNVDRGQFVAPPRAIVVAPPFTVIDVFGKAPVVRRGCHDTLAAAHGVD